MPDSKELRILLVDSSKTDAERFKRIVSKIPKNRFTVEWVDSYKQAQAEIAKDEHDIYVVNYSLNSKSGVDLLKEFNTTSHRQPFIMLTSAGDDYLESQAIRLGAADYLVKGYFDERLLARVLNYSTQRKLMEAQRIDTLMEINRSKDEFIAVASHELRTPATAVKQYIGMMTQGFAGEFNQSQMGLLNQAYKSNERQLRIIDDILRVARLDLDRISVDASQIDIIELVRSVMEDLQSVVDKRSQKIELKASKEPLLVEADEAYLRMAIANVVDNASKYSHEGGEIKIEVVGDDNSVQVRVTDNGVGVAEEDLDKLFDKFTRVHNPLSIERGGTGLGLYWARGVMQMHDGDITVESELDEGTTFTVHVPVASASIE